MTEANFYKRIKSAVQKKLDEDWNVEIRTDVKKNNNTTHTAIILGRENDKMRPQIYLKNFFGEYKNGKPISEIADNIIDCCQRSMEDTEAEMESVSAIKSWDSVKDRITFRLISKEMNREKLKDCIHEDFCDLAAMAVICLQVGKQGAMSISITRNLSENWDVTEKEILQAARENTPRLFPAKFKSLKETLIDIMGISPEILDENMEKVPMYILTNVYNLYGATVILYDSIMEDIYEKMGGKYMILPSSIHETIVVPFKEKTDWEELQNTVENVNQSHVLEEEVLSNNVYFYDGSKVVLACDGNGVCFA